MEINDRMHGFTVNSIREVKEIGGKLVEMTHDATGARLVWADNGDENKLFSVDFRTLRLRQISCEGAFRRTSQDLDEHLPQCDDLP